MSPDSLTRSPGVPVDGAEIRRAREQAGLSLAAVAGDHLSRTAVHRIEQGTMRPSMRTLQLIAARLGQPVQRFMVPPEQRRESRGMLEAEIILARIETLLVRGDVAAALARVMERFPDASSKREASQLCYLAARCHIRTSRPLETISFARRARSRWSSMGSIGRR